MIFYLDASAIVSLILRDAHTERMSAWIAEPPGDIVVSDFAALEFSSVVSRHVRINALSRSDALRAVDLFEEWADASAAQMQIESADLALANRLVLDFHTKLAAADALHLASAINRGATLVTFDQRMIDAARLKAVAAIAP